MTSLPNGLARLVAAANGGAASNPSMLPDDGLKYLFSSPGGFKCGVCERAFKLSTFDKHLKDHHSTSLSEAQAGGLIAYSDELCEIRAYVCDACEDGYHSNVKGNFKRHCEACDAAKAAEPIFELRSALIYKATGHFAGIAEVKALTKTQTIPEAHARVDRFVHYHQLIHQELLDEFNVAPKLVGAIESFITAATNGGSIADFVTMTNESLASPLPSLLAGVVNDWLQNYARPLSKTLSGKVMATLVTFKAKAGNLPGDEKHFKIWENVEELISEAKHMLPFIMGTCKDSGLDAVNHPLDLCQVLVKIATLPSYSNIHGLPPLCKYIAFRYVNLTPTGQKFQSMWFLSSVISRVMHLVRLAAATLCSTFTGENNVLKQLELCDFINNSHFMQLVAPIIRRVKHVQSVTPPESRACDEVTEDGDVLCASTMWLKKYCVSLVPQTRKLIIDRISNHLSPGSKANIEVLLEMESQIKICGGVVSNFSVNGIHCDELFEFECDPSADVFSVDVERTASYFMFTFHALSHGVRRLREVPRLDTFQPKFLNDYLKFWAECHKVPGVGVENKRLIEHCLPWTLGRLCLLFLHMLNKTGYRMKNSFNSTHAAQELFHLDNVPHATNLRNALTQFMNEYAGLNLIGNLDEALIDSYMWQTGHSRHTHGLYYHTNKAYSNGYESWHMYLGEEKYIRKESKLDMNDIRDALKIAYKSIDFLPGQQEMMQNVVSGRHFICRLQVGGGKSASWLLPALAGQSTGVAVGSTFVVTPYVFLGQHHCETARRQGIECKFLTAGNIQPGRVPKEFHGGIASIVFMTVDTFSTLLGTCTDFLKLCIQRSLLQRIIIDEAHLPFLECNFRFAYDNLRCILKTLPGIQLIALSGTLPHALAQHLATWYGMPGPIIQDCDDIGLAGIPLTVNLWTSGDSQVEDYVLKHLRKGHIHIYGQTKGICKRFRDRLRKIVDPDIAVYMVTGESTELEKKEVHLAIQDGRCHILLTTTCALVGFENKLVRSVLVLGFIYNIPSAVQAAGRLRPSQRDGCDCTFLVRKDDFEKFSNGANVATLKNGGLWNESVDRFVGPQALVDFCCTRECRMQFFSNELGFQSTDCCTMCDNCRNATPNCSQSTSILSQSSIGTFQPATELAEKGEESIMGSFYEIFAPSTTPSPLPNRSPTEGNKYVTPATQVSRKSSNASSYSSSSASYHVYSKHSPMASHRQQSSSLFANLKKRPVPFPSAVSTSSMATTSLLVESPPEHHVTHPTIRFSDLIALLDQKCLYCNKVECDGGACVGSNRCILCGKLGHESRACEEGWRTVLTGRACFSCAMFSTNGKCGRNNILDKRSCDKRQKRLLRVLMFGGLGREVLQHYQNRESFMAFALSSYFEMKKACERSTKQCAKRSRTNL